MDNTNKILLGLAAGYLAKYCYDNYRKSTNVAKHIRTSLNRNKGQYVTHFVYSSYDKTYELSFSTIAGAKLDDSLIEYFMNIINTTDLKYTFTSKTPITRTDEQPLPNEQKESTESTYEQPEQPDEQKESTESTEQPEQPEEKKEPTYEQPDEQKESTEQPVVIMTN